MIAMIDAIFALPHGGMRHSFRGFNAALSPRETVDESVLSTSRAGGVNTTTAPLSQIWALPTVSIARDRALRGCRHGLLSSSPPL